MTRRLCRETSCLEIVPFDRLRAGPFYATTAGEITVLVAGLISIVSYVLVMRVGNRPLQIVESAFVAAETGESASERLKEGEIT